MNKITAIYCRESTEKQNISTLVDMCVEHAKKLGLKNIKVYDDVASGYTHERDEYIQLKNDIQDNKIETLVLYESSRLTRDELEHHIFYRLLKVYDVKLYTVTHGWIDLNNEDDTFLTSLLNLLDAREGRKTAKRSKDRKLEIARQGYWTGGTPPLGYRTDEHKVLQIVPEEAEVVKEVFKMFLEGNTRNNIAIHFGLDPKKIRRMLINPTYIGKIRYRLKIVKNKKVIKNPNDPLLFPGKHNPIISELTFNLTQNKLSKTIREANSNNIYIFKDLITCACGAKMHKISSQNSYFCPVATKKDRECSVHILTENYLIENIFPVLKELINNLDVDNLQNTSDSSLDKQLKLYSNEISNIEKQQEKLTRQLLNETISEELFEKLQIELKEKKESILTRITDLQNKINNRKNNKSNSEILKKYWKKIENEKDPKKLNTFLKIIINDIRLVNDYRFYINLKI